MYFVALVLPTDLDEKILQFKKHMADEYNCRVGLKSPAHITLVPPFWMDENMESMLTASIESLSKRPCFTLSTNDFSAFKPRTIFVAVKESGELDQLKKDTGNYFENQPQFKIKPESRPFHAHITIATRDLYKKDFACAWPYFESKNFRETWKANGISILRHNQKNWDVIFTSQFKDF